MTPETFTTLYQDHERKLYYWIMSMTRNQDQAEDICSRAWAKAWAHRARITSNKAWLYQVAITELKNDQRRASYVCMEPLDAHTERLEPGDFTERLGAAQEWQAAAYAVLALPRRLRRAMTCAIEGMTTEEAGRAMRVPPGTAGSRLNAARRQVRALCAA
jgi:RNA polymerase sigma-70 factor (ECF subfamily)